MHEKMKRLINQYQEHSENEKKKQMEIDMLEVQLIVNPFGNFEGTQTEEEWEDYDFLHKQMCIKTGEADNNKKFCDVQIEYDYRVVVQDPHQSKRQKTGDSSNVNDE